MAFDTEKYTASPYIKGDDIEDGERMVLTVKEAFETTFPSGDTVPILSFLEITQQLTLNKTRVKKLVEILGDDTEEWSGKKISLYRIDVSYNGKTMPGIAVAAPPKKRAGAEKQKPEVKFDEENEDDPFA